MVLSYPQYCRYRSILKRIQAKPSSVLADQFVQALGGIPIINKNTKILYCRDTFDHPTLIDNESICDEFGKSHCYKTNVISSVFVSSGYYYADVAFMNGASDNKNCIYNVGAKPNITM